MLILEFVLGILIGIAVLFLPAVGVFLYWGLACDEEFENGFKHFIDTLKFSK